MRYYWYFCIACLRSINRVTGPCHKLRPGNVHATLDAHATNARSNEESAVGAAVAHAGHPGDGRGYTMYHDIRENDG